ncbi:peptidylprolyl isomerase [Elysia marginata]|uniref:peptidylprolyl isomerase n=1 Tax=Elysia marginata TaxID=1093978 RepID=A0AAV4IP04_9GAST|nr:peptidylprolyl isomerase [Elysia marginata]
MFFSADDDEQDFMSPGGSKLANIFGMDRASGGNESLTYTAPKQPKKKEATPEGGAPAVLVASVVSAYKYVDNSHTSQGKLGVALLGNRASKDYRILLYVNKQQQVTNAKITSSFTFNIQKNNYATFYDDARQTWSIMFDTTENAVKFAKEMALAKANASPGDPTELIQQDLVQGDGGALEQGDSVEVKYTGWLFSAGTLGKGWDQGMLGLKKGGKRMIVIPAHLAYGSQGVANRIPPDSTLVFEVEAVRVKLQKGDATTERPAAAATPTSSAAVSEAEEQEDHTIKGRTKSINEQLTHSTGGGGGKSKLISRMAKMGQPMLPFQGAVPAQPEDSDEDMGEQAGSQPPSPKPAPPPKRRSSSNISSVSSTVQPGVAMQPQVNPLGVNPSAPLAAAQPGVVMVGGNPMVVDPATGMLQPQAQQQPAFLQNLPGAQQLAVYQNPNILAQHQQQQQQAAVLQQQLQQQQQQQQQQQLLQQQMLGQGLPGMANQIPGLAGDALTPALLSESRQQNTEVRISLSKMSDKVDKILEKLESPGLQQAMHPMMGAAMAPYGSALPAPSMEANVLMQNITRIVQSQSALEQRNEGYKHSASQSQARVLALEQDKVQLATDLSTASSQISTLQLELAEFRRREAELRQKLQETNTSSSNTKEEVSRLTAQREEDEQKISSLTEGVRELKQARKALEAKLASSTEEMADLKSTAETLEKTLSDRKRKAAEERRKLEEDMEDAKISYEQTIESLRERLRKQKKSVDAETESKVSQLEEEISREWQAKSNKMVAAAEAKHARQVEEFNEEKDELKRKVDTLEKKLETVRSSGSSTEQQVAQLQDELADMRVWKEKYEKLRAQAGSMKDKYEERIQSLEQERDEASEEAGKSSEQQTQKYREKVEELQQEMQTLRQQLLQARADAKVAVDKSQQSGAQSAGSSADVATEVKKIMNSVFQSLRAEFEADESYTGSEILGVILNVIKQTTLKLVNPKKDEEENDEEEDEDEEDDDDEEEEEEEEEETENEGIKGDDAKQEEHTETASTSQQAAENSTSLTQDDTTDNSHASLDQKNEAGLGSKDSTEQKEDPSPANSRSSEGTGSDFEIVSEQSIEQEIGREDVTKEAPHVDEIEETEDAKSDSSGKATPVREIDATVEEEQQEEKDKTPEAEKLTGQKEAAEEISSPLDEPDVEVNVPPTQEIVKEPEPEVLPAEASPPSAPGGPSKGEKSKQTNVTVDANSREPPPLFDDDDDNDQDSPLFGKDDTVSDTFGVDFTSKPRTASNISSSQPAKKVDLGLDEDSKPQPPPPLFGDDSDDDDLDWLN